ncbi:MAG: hypothetical protein LBU27_03015 [Candidatus Peribacteria bacterium]|jgi:prophage tail gpP-like protein|nr:hypothetical protein [Candidatus Peribacteria bacterium]
MLLAKFYANQRSTEVIAQREIISKVEIETSLDDFGVAQLSIPIIDGVEEDSKIEIYEVGQNNDRRVFVGFIYEIKPVWQRRNMMDITARNEKGIMQKRKVLPGYDFKDKSVQEIVSTLLNEYAIYNDHWTSEIRFEKSISLELQQGDTYADIFDEIAEMTESYWDIMDGNVIFAENIGKQLPATIIYDGGSDNP